jgi:hypothetical protein
VQPSREDLGIPELGRRRLADGVDELQASQSLEDILRLRAKGAVALDDIDRRRGSRETAVYPIGGVIDDDRSARTEGIEEQPVLRVNR